MIAKFGLFAENGARNSQLISGALSASGGADVEMPAGEYPIDPSIVTGRVICSSLTGAGAGYQQTTGNQVVGRVTVLTSSSPIKTLPLLRVRCNSLTGGRFELRGQPYL